MTSEKEILPSHKHSKLGQWLFNVSAASTRFFIKQKIFYYVLQFTWNLPMTLFGGILALIALIAKCFGVKVEFGKFYWVGFAKIGPDYWGGCDTGLFFLRDHKSEGDLMSHEWGHTFEGVVLGPLFIFLVAIPSAVRWWIDWFKQKKTGQGIDYNAFWAEDAASACGNWAVAQLNEKK